eukprot:Skav205262  [mRNA]  locus=scaffold1841:123645:126175:- [translate_table: standard]
MGDTRALQARVEELEARVRELEAEQELQELRAIVEAQEAAERNEKRLGGSSASSGGLGIKGPSPRMTPRSASASDSRRAHGGGAMAVGIPPSLPLLRQEA